MAELLPYSSSRLMRVYRIIECPICSDTFRRTAVLPCAHTFCLRCLSRYVADLGVNTPRVNCPICRKGFELDDEKGLINLPRNFVVEGVVEALTGRSSFKHQDCEEIKSCALCCAMEIEDEDLVGNNQAIEFCRQCRHNMCSNCANQHRLVFPVHRVCPIGNQKTNRNLKRRQYSNFCSKHKKEELLFYCFHCLTTTCAICRHQLHRQHDCPPISDVFDAFVDEMQFELGEVSDFCVAANHVSKVIECHKARIQDNCSSIREEIFHRSEQLKNMIDSRANCLLHQVASLKDCRLNELEQSEQVLKNRLNTLDSFVKCYARLKDIATPHDVALRIGEFHEKSALLLDVNVITEATQAYQRMTRILFETTESEIDWSYLFGNISFDQGSPSIPIKEKIIRESLYESFKRNQLKISIIFIIFTIIIYITNL